MLTEDFKAFARNLSNVMVDNGVHADVYQILNIADALYVPPAPPTYDTHEARVQAALGNAEVRHHMRNGQKIKAIKELRAQTLCGLKEAKDAVEDDRVMVHYQPGY